MLDEYLLIFDFTKYANIRQTHIPGHLIVVFTVLKNISLVNAASIMVGGNRAVIGEKHNHPQLADKFSHLCPERKLAHMACTYLAKNRF